MLLNVSAGKCMRGSGFRRNIAPLLPVNCIIFHYLTAVSSFDYRPVASISLTSSSTEGRNGTRSPGGGDTL